MLPVTDSQADGTFAVDTPCSNHATVTGTPISGANVVLDPGHGGNESGAVGPAGLVEKDVNFDVTRDVQQLLEAQGATVVLTRTGDYNTTLKTRAEIAVDSAAAGVPVDPPQRRAGRTVRRARATRATTRSPARTRSGSRA